MIITLIFSDSGGEPVSLRFSKNPAFDGLKYGTWNTDTNEIELSAEAWNVLQANRKDIRKLKPMLDSLEKISFVAQQPKQIQ